MKTGSVDQLGIFIASKPKPLKTFVWPLIGLTGGGDGVASRLGAGGGTRESGRYEVGPSQLTEATSCLIFILFF